MISATAELSAYYQWTVKLTGCHSTEVDGFPTAHLWIPPGCDTIKAVALAQQNMTEERIFKLDSFRDSLARMSVAQVWVAPAFSMDWNPISECQPVFEQMMIDLAAVSGHPELADAPIVPLGHSAQATFPWNFAAWNPDRTLCVISFHGDAPRTNLCGYGRDNVEWGRTRNIDGIPGLMIEGEYEWWEARVNPALAFRMMYPASCISFLCDTGRGHFDCSESTAMYIATFIAKSMAMRLLPDGGLRKIDPAEGWLAERFHSEIPATDGADKGKMPQHPTLSYSSPAPYAEYAGDAHDAFWYHDREMASEAYSRYMATKNKKMQFLGIRFNGEFVPLDKYADRLVLDLPVTSKDMIFRLEPVYTDSTHIVASSCHGSAIPKMEIICGPAKQVSDCDFQIYDHEAGKDNPRRSFIVWACAAADGADEFKGAVMPICIRLK